MATDVEIERSLAAITATINDQELDSFDRERVQEIVTGALAGEERLTVDDGGGLHDESGTRIGAVRRTPSGEWIAERQNDDAVGSDASIPSAQDQGSLLDRVKGKLPGGGS